MCTMPVCSAMTTMATSTSTTKRRWKRKFEVCVRANATFVLWSRRNASSKYLFRSNFLSVFVCIMYIQYTCFRYWLTDYAIILIWYIDIRLVWVDLYINWIYANMSALCVLYDWDRAASLQRFPFFSLTLFNFFGFVFNIYFICLTLLCMVCGGEHGDVQLYTEFMIICTLYNIYKTAKIAKRNW